MSTQISNLTSDKDLYLLRSALLREFQNYYGRKANYCFNSSIIRRFLVNTLYLRYFYM